jgi:hypothetical protein
MSNDFLYLEAHITFEPVFGDDLARLTRIAERNGFKVADLLMPQRAKYDTFMTGHGEDMADLVARTVSLVYEAKDAGFKIWRYKIEKAVIDSRHSDALNLGVERH